VSSAGALSATPGVVCTLRADGWVDAVVPGGAHLTAGPWLLKLLGEFGAMPSFTMDDVLGLEFWTSDEEALRALTALVASGVLRTTFAERPVSPPRGAPTLDWGDHGWGIARVFHDQVVDTDFTQGDPEGWALQLDIIAGLAAEGGGPPPTKDYEGAVRVPLEVEPAALVADFSSVLKARRTCREFATDARVDASTLASVLDHAARATGTIMSDKLGPLLLKTSPSGGARHPVEIYPQIIRVDGVATGNYYYDPVRHDLALISDTSEELLFQLGQRQRGCQGFPVAFIVTARFCRNMWKYRYAKSYLFTLFDVAHLVQTLVLTCEAAGWGCFITPAIQVEKARLLLGLGDVYDECPAYFVAAGPRR
jgi:SagB-type dehydrogenase family enzyme